MRTLVVAIIAAITALASTGFTIWGQLRIQENQSELETLRSELDLFKWTPSSGQR